jgi:hypothetical protein
VKLLVSILAVFVLALCLTATASGKKRWPKPPAWWINSPGMKCVRYIESKNGAASTNLYGMLDGWGEAGGRGSAWNASPAEQHYRAWLLWRRYGMSAWCPWDGCCPT